MQKRDVEPFVESFLSNPETFAGVVSDLEKAYLAWEQTMHVLPQEGMAHAADDALQRFVARHDEAKMVCDEIEGICFVPQHVEDQLMQAVGERIGANVDLLLLSKLTPQEEEAFDLMRIAKRYQEEGESGEGWLHDLEKHYQRYCFTALGLDHYRKRVRQLVVDNREIDWQQRQVERAAMLAELNLNEKQLLMIETVRQWLWLKHRRAHVQAYARYRLGPIVAEQARRQGMPDTYARAHGMQLTGMTASRGQASGQVHIVHTQEDMDAMPDGAVLVIAAARPEYTVLFARACAVICDTGGATSHAAIIAREYKVPCIVATREATIRLKNGMQVDVDATAGRVRIL